MVFRTLEDAREQFFRTLSSNKTDARCIEHGQKKKALQKISLDFCLKNRSCYGTDFHKEGEWGKTI